MKFGFPGDLVSKFLIKQNISSTTARSCRSYFTKRNLTTTDLTRFINHMTSRLLSSSTHLVGYLLGPKDSVTRMSSRLTAHIIRHLAEPARVRYTPACSCWQKLSGFCHVYKVQLPLRGISEAVRPACQVTDHAACACSDQLNRVWRLLPRTFENPF